MNRPKFSVSRFKNPTGSYSWRVDGRLNGVRIRRNFKTQEEASAEKAVLEIKGAQIAHLDAAHISNVEQPQAFTDATLDFLLG